MIELQNRINKLGLDIDVDKVEGKMVYVSHPYDLEADRPFASELLKSLSDITKETGFRFTIRKRED